jgi:hypothetical protein
MALTSLALVLCVLLNLTCFAQLTISGKVVTSDSKPLDHAFVQARPAFGHRGGTVGDHPGDPWVQIDGEGIFKLAVNPGRYRILAKSERDGYPDPTFFLNFDPTSVFPLVNVGGKSIAGAKVVLGRRGAFVEGTVRNASNHVAIRGAKVKFELVANSVAFVEVFTDANGRFQFAIPAKPIRVTVSANGFKEVAIDGGAGMALSSGERRTLLTELKAE